MIPSLPRGHAKPLLALTPEGDRNSNTYSVYYREHDSIRMEKGPRDFGTPHGFHLVTNKTCLIQTLESLSTENAVLVVAPGLDIELDRSIELKKNGTVLLGLGLCTITFTEKTAGLVIKSESCILACFISQSGVAGLQDVILCESSEENSDVTWTAFFDVYVKIGGPGKEIVSAKNALRIASGSKVILENIWLWRADHLEGNGLFNLQTNQYSNDCKSCL